MYWSGGPFDMLDIIPMLDERLMVPVGKIDDDELNGFTSAQGVATRRIGVHESGDSESPRN